MKIISGMPDAPPDRRQGLQPNGGTGFQQLIQGLEKSMWPGAHAGLGSTGANMAQTRVNGQGQGLPLFFSLAADKAIASTPVLADGPERVSQDMHTSPALGASLRGDDQPFALHENDEHTVLPPAPRVVTMLQASSDDAPEQAPLRTASTSRVWRAAPATEYADSVTLLPGTTMPTIVVRYTGEGADTERLRSLMQETLRRHGISQASWTINGFEYPSRIESGVKHGN